MKDKPRKSWMVELPTSKSPARVGGRRSTAAVPLASGRKSAVSGLGLTSERARERMVERLVEQGIRDPRVLAAMGTVERHRFVDQGLASRAYEDSALPIGHGQTISQPYIVARMSEVVCAGLRPSRVLEIGTGCGYQAAVLALLAVEVYSIERVRALHDRARANLRAMRVPNLRLVYGDGLKGIPDAAPFDAMLVAAAGDDLPAVLLEQLKVGGRAIAPFGRTEQTLCLITRAGAQRWTREPLEAVRFVPLLPGLV